MTSGDPGWRVRGVRTARDALACCVEGEGKIWAHRDDPCFMEIKRRGYATYRPGKDIMGQDLAHGHWIPTDAGKAKYKELSNA